MAHCKKFIAGIGAINFTESSARLLRQALLSCAYQELQQELKEIEDRKALLPQRIQDSDLGNKQLIVYKQKQDEAALRIKAQLKVLENLAAEAPPFKLETKVVIDEAFIQDFAINFRNIRHLAETLSDAPTIIKQQQTRLYTEILFKLTQREQETQLQTLSFDDIREMIKQALVIYERETDIQLRNQAQTLIHMGIFEIVRGDCERIKAKEKLSSYAQYQEFLLLLSDKLLDVGVSDVIDNLSEYRDTKGRNIADLLQQIENKLNITQDDSWNDDSKIKALKTKKALFHKLRFGQEDRREYVGQVQSNLARDLFWGRNIRDTELFTVRGVSEDVFSMLVQQNFLINSKFEKTDESSPDFSLAERRLKAVIDAVKVTRKPKKNGPELFPIGNSGVFAKNTDALSKMVETVSHELKEKFTTPTFKIINGFIQVDFYYTSLDGQTLSKNILSTGGIGFESTTLLKTLRGLESAVPGIEAITLRGKTLAEIRNQIKTLGNEKLEKACSRQLGLLEQAFKREDVKEIADLKLSNDEEVLLRKLLELQFIAPIHTVTDNSKILEEALKRIGANQFKNAVKIEGLEDAVKGAYERLAALNAINVPSHALPILQKAKTLFSEERKEKLNTLNDLLKSTKSATEKENELTKLFVEEYTGMSQTLGLSSETEFSRLEADVRGMAREIIKLIERTEKGLPALTPKEEAAYFDAIQQIARELSKISLSMHEVQFKIPHGLKAKEPITLIDIHGKKHQFTLDLKTEQLPYSLIKPPGASDFIFSYGGSRGIIAPFAGLDEAYAGVGKKKGRLFTHSRLLGVGQYGSVKEVESLLSGLNQVTKKGYALDTEPFTDESRSKQRTRPITARKDPYYRVERDLMQNLSAVAKASGNATVGETQYWLEMDKPRFKGELYAQDGSLQQYRLLTARAKGQTFADKANKDLNYYPKDRLAYHDPTQRKANDLDALTDMLALSQALVSEAYKLQTLGSTAESKQLGFAHNDIKPENFIYKRKADGSFEVRYIDWATGGFVQKYTGKKEKLDEIFVELFGEGLTFELKDNKCTDKNGRFVRIEEGSKIVYGINPTLQILHGARNGTLPYISPQVLGKNREKQSQPAGVYNSDFNTVFEANDPTSDDWALTAMTFGICNLEAYFALVKGRAVADYVIPGILALEGLPPHEKLVIIDDKKFTEFFACRNPSDSSAFNTGVVATHPTPVMFIPSNQREGEPLHLFRRLQELQRSLASDKDVDESKTKIAREIETILSTVYNAIASGKGLNKQELTKQLDAAQRCLQNYEKIKDTNYQEGLLKQEVLHSLLKAIHERPVSADDLLKSFPEDGPSQLKILCTYPSSVEQKKQVVEIFQKTFSESAFVDKFIGEKAPARDLFKDMIARHQTEILISLLAKIPENKNEDFIKIVSEDGLLHYAAEQGLTKVFGSLVDALTRAGATPTAILDLSLIEYKSGPKQAHNASHLRWSTSCFHIAIRNNNPKLLARLLTLLPDENNDKNIIDEALHFCAVLGNKQLFQQIEKARLHATSPVTAARIMGIKLPPEYLSPYHLFLNNEATLAAIKWKTLTNQPELGKQFLLSSDGNPLLIAAAKANFAGVFQLLELGKAIDFEDWTKVLSETDANGKNLLNYMLELNQLEHLSRFINFIKETTENSNDILVQLLSNPHPVNPLKNFLSQQTNSDQHFVVVKMLLDTICSNFATATIEQQQARVVALLINKDWLIEQAKDTKNFEELNKLLQNEALSIPFKQSLFKTLKEASQDNVARTFYEKLLTEVSRIPVEIDKKTQLEISGVFAEVIRQSSDFEELFKALTEEHKVASEFERDARDLKEKVQKYAEKEQRLESTLKQQQVEATELKETLHQTKDQLEKASVLTLKLQQKSEKATKDYLAKETLLKQEIEKEKSSVAAVEEELREAKEQHQQEQERLVCALKEVESHINVLKQELEEKSSELDSKGKSYRQLEAQYKELEENKNSLVEELKHSKSVEKETQEKLLAEIKTREGKESDLQELGKQLDALRDEKTKLGQELESLQTLNKRLGEENSELQQRVKEYKENSETLDRELKKYLSEVVTLKEGLQETQEKLQEASARTSQLEEEIKTKQDEYDRQEASLKEEIEETKKTSESGIKAAEEKLRQAKEQHQQEQERLVCALKEVESHINVLKQELEEKSSELDSKGKSYRQLEAQYKELEENKNSLVEELKHSKSVEKETQEKLLAEIKTREGKESDLQELGKQLDALRDEKTKLGQELESLQTLNKRLGEENSELQQRVKEYKENSETLDRELKKYLSEVVTLKEGLQETQEKLQEASARTSQLEQEIENTTTAFLEKEILLKKQIEETKQSAERDVAGVKQKLAEAEKSYQVTLNSLSVSLKEVTEEVQQLQSSLQEKDLQFKVKEESYKKLETESAELKQLKEKLQKELSDSKRLSESTISELQMKLDVETKAGVDKQAKLQELSQQLGNLQATLKSQTEELQTKNGELEDVKRFLESEHIRFSQELETIKKQIEEERYKAQEAETKQKQAEKSAEEAQLETRRILEEMKRLRKEMEIQEAKVKAREQRVAEREQQVEERAAEVEALHQEVLRVEEDVHRREDELAHAEIPIENPRELARRKAITALKAKFARSIDDDLLTAISHATSNEDLAKLGLDLKYLAVLEHDDYLLIADATDERLTQLQEERSEIKTELLERNYKAVLGENREKLRRIYNNLNKIDTLDKGITNELNYLVQISPLHWFSPAFQASLKKNAHELAPHYERLAEGCNVVVDYLKPLSIELKHQFRSLPSIEEIEHLPENSPKRSDIESRRALLTRYLQRVQGQLDLYEPLYKLLNGDPAASNPLLRQGIRKTLKYAQDEKYSLKFSSFSSDYRDYSQEERALHLQAGYESNVEGNVTEISSNTGLAHYQVVESAKQNYFREHIINPDDQFCGYFIEDRAKNLDSPLYGDSLKGYRPSITITVSKFPQGPDSRDPQLIAARVQYALAVATHLLSEFVEPPTAKDPVIMRGPNPEELRYLWTAMVLVGKEVSGFQFPPEAVAVASAVFKPGLEMEKTGFWGGWTTQWRANSCYETSFRGQPSVDIWLTGLKEASRHRANFKGESDRIKKLVGDVTQTFFGNAKAKTVVEDLKQEVLKNGPNAGG